MFFYREICDLYSFIIWSLVIDFLAILPPDGTCVPLAVSSFRFLSSLPFTLVTVIDPVPDRRPNIHKTDISACHSTFRLCCVRVGSVLVGAWF